MDSYSLPSVVGVEQLTRSGYAKRKNKKSLPRVFFLYDKGSRRITGAFLLTGCAYRNTDPNLVYWTCDRAVFLDEPVTLQAADIQWTSTLVHLKPDAEQKVRMLGARVGGALNNHFADYALSRWHCWPASDTSNLKIQWDTEHPFTFTSHLSYSKAVGIEPDLVEYFRTN